MTKKELIIYHFEKMNIRMLDVLLDDSKTYQNASKDIFLEKLELAFKIFKNINDTFLTAYKGSCGNKECPNKGCRGFSFVGNVSGRRIDLIFEDTGADYADIYECHGMDSESVVADKSFPICLDFKQDEQTDFKPGIDLLIQLQKCGIAYEELQIASIGKIIDPEIYMNWLEKYRGLYEEFDMPPLFYRSSEKFYSLYDEISHLASFINFDEAAGNAYTEYQLNASANENELLQWLCKYEQLGDQLILFPFPDNFSASEVDKGYFIFHGIRINVADFDNIIRFKKMYDKCCLLTNSQSGKLADTIL